MISKRHKKDTLMTHLPVFIAGAFFFLVVFLANFLILRERQLSDRIYPNVYIDKVNVGDKTKDQVIQMFHSKDEPISDSTIFVTYQDQQVATLSAQDLNIHSNRSEVIDRAFTIGRSSHISSRIYQKLATIFGLTHFNFSTGITYDKNAVDSFVSDAQADYNKPAENALFTFENGKVSAFHEDKKGLKINTDQFYRDFEMTIAQLQKNPGNKTIKLTDSVVEPDITLAKANNLGIEELIGEGQSNYTHSAPERIHNLSLAASKFNGVVVPQGKMISYNEIVGDISAATGYVQGYIIKDGHTVLGDGGGVCQVSTTLFRAGMNTGLPVIERTAHAYRVIYYENDAKPGMDATIFSPSVDLKLKNDTPGAILIQVNNDQENKELTIKFYGKKDGRKVELSPVTVYDETAPPPPLYQDDPSLPNGTVKQVDFAAWGAKSKFSYKVTLNDKVTFQKDYVNVYRPWQAVFLRGIGG